MRWLFFSASSILSLSMSSKRLRFFKRVIVISVLMLFVAQVSIDLLGRYAQSSMSSELRRATAALQSSTALLDSSDNFSAFAAITATLVPARDQLRTRAAFTERMQHIASYIKPASFGSFTHVENTERVGAQINTAADTFSWLASASPTLEHIAGYDAARDIASAPNDRDVFGRLYSAHVGLTVSLQRLSNPPAAVQTPQLIDLRSSVQQAIAACEAAIRAIDTNTPSAAHVQRYIMAANRAAELASTLSERFASESFKASLRALL